MKKLAVFVVFAVLLLPGCGSILHAADADARPTRSLPRRQTIFLCALGRRNTS